MILTNNKPLTTNNRGFTLIELMIVMTVIALVALVGLASNYFTSQKKARDSERKSDLNQYRIALETYASQKNGVYPKRSGAVKASTILCLTDLGSNFLSACPEDPKASTTVYYRYQTDNPGGCNNGDACATKFILWAKLEAPPGTNYWYVCSDGRAREKTSQPTASDCGIT